jgi:hypothetical protein
LQADWHKRNSHLEAENKHMKKFEYKVISIPTNLTLGTKGYDKAAAEFEAQLNKLGAEGWELVQRVDGFFFFKRELSVL